MTLLKDKKKTW